MSLMLSGFKVQAEVATATERIDAVVETATHVYIFEFKLTTPEEALAQIKNKGYASLYAIQS